MSNRPAECWKTEARNEYGARLKLDWSTAHKLFQCTAIPLVSKQNTCGDSIGNQIEFDSCHVESKTRVFLIENCHVWAWFRVSHTHKIAIHQVSETYTRIFHLQREKTLIFSGRSNFNINGKFSQLGICVHQSRLEVAAVDIFRLLFVTGVLNKQNFNQVCTYLRFKPHD